MVGTACYAEKVYAGVLGKTIGVMLGKPFEGWSHEQIAAKFGTIDRYVHDEVGYPLICTDDDTSGTFTFVRAIEDWGYDADIQPWQIGRTWLNYLIENKSVLWWGGVGASTEHTAYLRLLAGVDAPESGYAVRNGKRVSEQIGAQIFVDGWAMLYPNDPDRAVELATKAASVSHDGEAIHGARVLAAMESLAFSETRIPVLVEAALRYVPSESVIAGIVRDVAEWASQGDWRHTFENIQLRYGADKHGVGHMFPNHALIHLALWHGDGDFARSLQLVNDCGWDTDCNSGNLGCLLGLMTGLDGIPAWMRDPIADRLYLPTADSGRGITDCLTEAEALVRIACGLHKLPYVAPKEGARIHFSQPGATQGFRSSCRLSNLSGALTLHFDGGETEATTATFLPPQLEDMHGYELMASPTLYPGQTVRAILSASSPVDVSLLVRFYDGVRESEVQRVGPEGVVLEWLIPDLGGKPIYEVGFKVRGGQADVTVESLSWDGAPSVRLLDGELPARAKDVWVQAVEELSLGDRSPLRLVQNKGLGVALAGCREWCGYEFVATVVPRCGGQFGLGVHVQGLRRYLALLIDTVGTAKLVQRIDEEELLGEAFVDVEIDAPIHLALRVEEGVLVGTVGEVELRSVVPISPSLASGAIAVFCADSRLDIAEATVQANLGGG